ncbi:hypothetical protein APUTEX25_001817 [Auxenochlorella protothecoides]|uniref:Transmembrane protein 53 n=1 Tax=Auxenochlorella protothecoides TaxID=3075 RepID=A0A3M7L4V7_AUXPR|nr:hypothetical protein APUTEX25_001817 [Auxenochlorella protothecoides]|eukprot:RMZ57617.1 hypothetical protein APUTEX25_001817 [Auxenochlorella protothecoides]
MAQAQVLTKGPFPGLKPFVLLYGWLGCREAHLNKYANMWRVLGAEPHMIRVNTWDVIPPFHERAEQGLVQQAGLAGEAYAAHSAVQPGPGRPPVFVHTLSNAGYLAYGGMVGRLAWAAGFPVTHVTHPRDRFSQRQLQGLAAFQRIMSPTRGIIVDSAPSALTPDVWIRGVEAALRGNPLSSVSLAIFRAFYRRRMVEQLASGPYHDFLAEALGGWRTIPDRVGRMYAYSEEDDIIPAEDVETQILRDVAHSNILTRVVKFHGSGHVQHYRRFPDEYAAAVSDFALACLERGGPGPVVTSKTGNLPQAGGGRARRR